ncbi:MAG TPA: hypothetical protein PKB14_08175 [Rubrivivax sp.]|nr:hypothetical protein [Rubrivivax sp.]
MMISTRHFASRIALLASAAFAATALSLPPEALARPQGKGGGHGGGHAQQRGGAPRVNNAHADKRTNNVRNTSVNNVNVNRNVNIDVDNRGGCCHNGWDDDYHPIATAAAVTATVAVTSAVIGSIVHSVPPNCVPVSYGGMVYQQCGSSWYQPQGTQYIVVNPPY